MRKSSNLILGIVLAIGILTCLLIKIFEFEGKTSARRYREEYREQGRRQVRAEAVKAGVADYTEDGFVWRTNDIQRLEGELHNILIEALNKRSGYAKEDSEEKGDSQEESEEKFTGESQEESEEEGTGESQEEKRTSTQAEDGGGNGRASEGSQEEGTPSRSEEQDL